MDVSSVERGYEKKTGNRLPALMSSSAYDLALQHAREQNVKGDTSKEESHSLSLLLVLEISGNGSGL
jgi:hypothetical protein